MPPKVVDVAMVAMSRAGHLVQSFYTFSRSRFNLYPSKIYIKKKKGGGGGKVVPTMRLDSYMIKLKFQQNLYIFFVDHS